MSVLGNSLLLGAEAAGPTAYQVSRSLRFNGNVDSTYLDRTPASTGNRKTFTFSFWLKRTRLSDTYDTVLHAPSGSAYSVFAFYQDSLYLQQWNGGGTDWVFVSSAVYRDPSAWYHFVFAFDTTQATNTDRVKIYVNGQQVTTFSSATYPSQNADTYFNLNVAHYIGQWFTNGHYLDAYLAECHFIDGSAKVPGDFGETDATTGQWIPKAYTGSYGTNGFQLKFADNSNNTATTLGKDTSGNSNNWTPNNLSVTAGAGNDSLVDTPTSFGTDTGVGNEVRGNYCTLNPLNNGGVTLTNGNLDWQRTAGGSTAVVYSTIAVSSGKWYFETTLNGAGSGVNWEFGVATVGTSNTIRPGTTSTGWGLVSSSTTTLYKQNSNTLTTIFTGTLANGDIIGVALDLDNGRIWFARNGTWLEGSPSAGTGASYTNLSGTVAVFAGGDGSAVNGAFNAGARPFAYTAPSGFKALCDTNLPVPVVAKPSTVFDVVTRNGGGTTQTFTTLRPGLLWEKRRDSASNHYLYDRIRGDGAYISSNLTNAEAVATGQVVFNTNGYTITSGFDWPSSATIVDWVWDAGSTTTTNNSGSIQSSTRVNATAGFSIVTYTGTGANATVGHGLGVAPELVIVKCRSAANDWAVYHSANTSDPKTDYLLLNSTAATADDNTYWNDTAPTSTVFSIGTNADVNTNTATYVAYCFAPVAGYSAMGSYTGNGSADGPFVYTGFRPRWILIKRTDTSGNNWVLHDTARDTYNAATKQLLPSEAAAETDTSVTSRDILSNGFKLRGSNDSVNGSSATYIYCCFAESPFQYARAR